MILHGYFARKFLMIFLGLLAVFAVMITLLDMVEQLRRFDASEIALSGAFELALLSMPQALHRILPLIVILSTLALFLTLARTSELVVARAAGRSALRTLVAPAVTAAVIGVGAVGVLNPIVAGTMQRYEARASELSSGEARILSVSRNGLWLRQGDADGQTVIRAERANLDGTVLSAVTFLEFAPDADGEPGPLRRIEAAQAELRPGAWVLTDAKLWQLDAPNPEATAAREARIALPTTLTSGQIADSFGAPASVPIWELPAYIDDLMQAGFSARLHRIWFQMELATPVFLVGMVMIGAGFTMRHTRFGRTGPMVMLAIGMGFGAYFIRNLAQILGESGQIPVALAAWAPPIAAILLSLGLLLHLEDG
jgi:lipopolysaccharide export system permease protein